MTPTETSAGPFALLKSIECEHAAERRLCDKLETLADSLPEIAPADASEAVVALRDCLRRHIALEEGYLLPMLITRAQSEDNVKALSVQIAAEHAADEVLAHDIADELDMVVESGRVRNPEMLGFMLRGYFECRRRHLAWERAVVIPLAMRRLKSSDWRILSRSDIATKLESNPNPVGSGCTDAGCECGLGKKSED